jgi:HSP90 family molecular chaperone
MSSEYLNTLQEKRIKWVEASRENNFEAGIKNLLTELYPDNAHFIYELLQNAEDAGATKVSFYLEADKITTIHNGTRLFNKRDVEGITSIGEGTKRDDINKIGKFGVGFKAVFSYLQNHQFNRFFQVITILR